MWYFLISAHMCMAFQPTYLRSDEDNYSASRKDYCTSNSTKVFVNLVLSF